MIVGHPQLVMVEPSRASRRQGGGADPLAQWLAGRGTAGAGRVAEHVDLIGFE